jgi:hypothetical protein
VTDAVRDRRMGSEFIVQVMLSSQQPAATCCLLLYRS